MNLLSELIYRKWTYDRNNNKRRFLIVLKYNLRYWYFLFLKMLYWFIANDFIIDVYEKFGKSFISG